MSKRAKKSSGGRRRKKIVDGDFLLLDYVGRTKENNEVFDVTMEDVAREEGVWREDVTYHPEVCIIGKNFLVSGLEKALLDTKIGENNTFEVDPAEGFGKRDPNQIERIPVKSIIKETKTKPEVGKRVRYKGRIGKILSASQGRCRVDFNHPLAGKTLVFNVTVHERLDDMDAKVKALIARRIPQIDVETLTIEFNEETKEATIDVPFRLLSAEGIDYVLLGLASDLWRHLGFEEVKTSQTFDFRPKETEEEQTKEETEKETDEEVEEETSSE